MEENYFLNPAVHIYDSTGAVDTPELKSLVEMGPDSSVRYYDTESGFYKIKNPGWIVFDLGVTCQVAYIRLLLWDNCGGVKKQPSRRKYTYRLLVAEDVPGCDACYLTWKVVYYNVNSGSNGWQEFVFSQIQSIRYVKIHAIANTSNEYTHIVNIQAYGSLTEVLHDYLNLAVDNVSSQEKSGSGVVPPIKGFVNNRIIIESDDSLIDPIISTCIYKEILGDLDALVDSLRLEKLDYSRVLSFRDELMTDDANSKSMEHELLYFQKSLLKPLEDELSKQKRRRKFMIFAQLVSVVSIIYGILDLFLF